MAKGRENGTTILLGLRDYKVGEVWGGEARVMVRTEVKGRIITWSTKYFPLAYAPQTVGE